jgi:hypothetical protein
MDLRILDSLYDGMNRPGCSQGLVGLKFVERVEGGGDRRSWPSRNAIMPHSKRSRINGYFTIGGEVLENFVPLMDGNLVNEFCEEGGPF